MGAPHSATPWPEPACARACPPGPIPTRMPGPSHSSGPSSSKCFKTAALRMPAMPGPKSSNTSKVTTILTANTRPSVTKPRASSRPRSTQLTKTQTVQKSVAPHTATAVTSATSASVTFTESSDDSSNAYLSPFAASNDSSVFNSGNGSVTLTWTNTAQEINYITVEQQQNGGTDWTQVSPNLSATT